MKWKLYYQNGSFSSDDGEWVAAPSRGVQALAIPHPTARRQIQSGDFYWWPDWCDYPISGDVFGVIDWLLTSLAMRPDERISDLPPEYLWELGIKWGRSLDSGTYSALYQQVVADADLIEWGPKTTRTPYER